MASVNTTSRSRTNRNVRRDVRRDFSRLEMKGLTHAIGEGSRKIHFNPDHAMSSNNAYAKTLADPFATIPCTIPDMCVFDTGLVSLAFRVEVPAVPLPGGGFVAGFMVNGWRPRGMMNRLQVDVNNGNFLWTNTGLPAGDNWGAAMPNFLAFTNLAQSYRVVSAGFTVSGTMSSLNDSGFQVGVNIPTQSNQIGTVGYNARERTEFASAEGINQMFTAVRAPIKTGGTCICYKPVSPQSYQFNTTDNPAQGGASEVRPYYGGGVWYAGGLVEESTFTVTVKMNLEFIPKLTATSFVDMGPSISDHVALDHAVNKIAREPSVEMGPDATAKSRDVSRVGVEHHEHPHSVDHRAQPTLIQKGLSAVANLAKDIVPKVLPGLLALL